MKLHKVHEDGRTEVIEFRDGCYIHTKYNPKGRVDTVTETYQFNGRNKFTLMEEYTQLGFVSEDELKKAANVR